jgi:hypothetical protein
LVINFAGAIYSTTNASGEFLDRFRCDFYSKVLIFRCGFCFQRVPNLIGGSFVESQSSSFIDVINPATQEVVSKVPLTTNEEFKAAVSAAKQAFPLWRNTPITTRQRVMLKFQELIRKNMVATWFSLL